jgi:hypothetical protein
LIAISEEMRNMYVVVETWTPKPAFFAADEKARNDLFAGIREAMKQLADIGFVTLGWGRVEPAAQSASYEWFAVWQAPSREVADVFLAGVVGELRPADAVLAEHLALEAEVK